jgi:hypothetical protein
MPLGMLDAQFKEEELKKQAEETAAAQVCHSLCASLHVLPLADLSSSSIRAETT